MKDQYCCSCEILWNTTFLEIHLRISREDLVNSRLGRISLLKFQCARVEVKILSDSTVFYFLDLKYVVYLKDYRVQIFSKHGILTKKDIKSSFVELLCEVLKIGLTLPYYILGVKTSSIWKGILL